jgi:tRNA threonylcarbamoyladenosine biosynthesis protein TsaE
MGRIGLKPGNYPLANLEETLAFGKLVSSLLPPYSVLALTGELGAGKTSFVQGLAQGLGISEPVQSPTFVLLNVYDKLAHFDLYRLKSDADFQGLGFDEYLGKIHLCAIEWPEKVQKLLPPDTVCIDFIYEKEGRIAKLR